MQIMVPRSVGDSAPIARPATAPSNVIDLTYDDEDSQPPGGEPSIGTWNCANSSVKTSPSAHGARSDVIREANKSF